MSNKCIISAIHEKNGIVQIMYLVKKENTYFFSGSSKGSVVMSKRKCLETIDYLRAYSKLVTPQMRLEMCVVASSKNE